MSNINQNANIAPYPYALLELVEGCRYRPLWELSLRHMDRGQGSVGLTLIVLIDTTDTYDDARRIRVQHLFPVPPASYDRRSWQRWLFDQLRLVDRHEAMELFVIDGERPYAPSHGPGNDPYMIREVGTDIDRRTSFRGEVST